MLVEAQRMRAVEERRSSTPRIQAKLSVNTPGDAFEQEAEAMADAVAGPAAAPALRLLSEKPSMSSSSDGLVRRRSISARPSSPGDVSEVVDPIVRNEPGSALDGSTRTFMESRFGHDFSQVRVHTSDGASASAQSIGARAYTVGQHLVFGQGQYAPHSSAGRHLLAHELTHVVQQAGGSSSGMVQRAGEVVQAPNWSPNARLTFDPHATVVLDDGRIFGTWFPGNPNAKMERVRVPKDCAGTMSMTANVWWLWDHPSFEKRFGLIVVSADLRFKVDSYGKIEFSTPKPPANITNDAVGQITVKGDASALPGAQFGGNVSLTAAIEAAAQVNLTQGSNSGTQTTSTRTDENSVETSATPLDVGVKAGGKVSNATANTQSQGATTSSSVTLVGAGGWNRTYGVDFEIEGIGERRGEVATIFFKDEGLTTLSDESINQLLMFTKNLPTQPREELLKGMNHLSVVSYASVTGTAGQNLHITEMRSASVRNAIMRTLDWLKGKPDAIQVENRGNADADASTKTPQASDRRVDIGIWWTEGVPSGAAASPR